MDFIEHLFYNNFVQEQTKQKIILTARQELALHGFEGCSIRTISKKVGVSPSVLYYHFANKEALLNDVFVSTNYALGQARSLLKSQKTFLDLLKQRIHFQFDHAEEISAVLKYYMHFRSRFRKNSRGYLPKKTYLHIEEILQFVQAKGMYSFPSIEKESKVIVHAINGFILEYFPTQISKKEKVVLVNSISDFILRAISPYRL